MKRQFKWVSADGEETALPKMTDQHLMNCILFMERRAVVLYEAFLSAAEDFLEDHPHLCGNHVQAFHEGPEHEASAVLHLLSDTAYRALYEEAVKRGLPVIPADRPSHRGWTPVPLKRKRGSKIPVKLRPLEYEEILHGYEHSWD